MWSLNVIHRAKAWVVELGGPVTRDYPYHQWCRRMFQYGGREWGGAPRACLKYSCEKLSRKMVPKKYGGLQPPEPPPPFPFLPLHTMFCIVPFSMNHVDLYVCVYSIWGVVCLHCLVECNLAGTHRKCS